MKCNEGQDVEAAIADHARDVAWWEVVPAVADMDYVYRVEPEQ